MKILLQEKEKTKRYIFLDIDGVICTQRMRFDSFDPECMVRLQKIIEATDAKIVISSTWRLHATLEQLQGMFMAFGYCFRNRVIGVTPRIRTEQDKEDLSKPFGRGLEILTWLKDKEVEKYVVIDDDSFDIPSHKHVFVKTDCYTGLQDADVDKAISLLT